MTISRTRKSNVRWRSVALPTEHGGWGFISEPVLLGLLLAPSVGGFALSIGAFAAFLLRQPLKLLLKDMRHGRRVPRTDAARRFVLIYSVIGALAGIVILLSVIPAALVPLLVALPLAGIQLIHDLRSSGRALVAELAGAVAPGAIASTIVLIQDWSLPHALGLWLALAVKSVTAVLYVRARLRLERGKSESREWVIFSHVAGFALFLAAVRYKFLPWTASVAMGLLLLRAVIGLSSMRKARPPKIIGMQEAAYGLAFVLLTALGYALS